MNAFLRHTIGPDAPWRYRYNCWYRWLFAPLGRLILLILKLGNPLWRLLWRKTEGVRQKCAPVTSKIACAWAKIACVRKIIGWILYIIGQIVRWVVNLVLVLLILILCGGTGFLVKTIAVPVANHYGVPLSIGSFDLYPLAGHIRITDFRVDNPKTFIEKDSEVYTENPLVAFAFFEVDVDMKTLFSGDEYVVDNIELRGLRALYAFDCDTTNVDALIAQILGTPAPAPEAPSEPEPQPQPEPTPEPEPSPEPQQQPEPQPEPQPAAEPAPEAQPEAEAKELRFRIAQFKLEDNWISLRNGNLMVPLAISLPLPPVEMHDIDNYTLGEWVDGVVTKLMTAVDLVKNGVGNALELLGDGLGAGVEALGNLTEASLEVLGDVGAATAEIATEAGAALAEGAKSVVTDGAKSVGEFFSSGAKDIGNLFSSDEAEPTAEAETTEEAPKKDAEAFKQDAEAIKEEAKQDLKDLKSDLKNNLKNNLKESLFKF